MAIIENVITPIVQSLAILGFLAWIIYLIYKGIKSIFPDLRYNIRYGLLRKPYDPDKIEWLVARIEEGKTLPDVKKFLLLKNRPMSEVKEMDYLYRKVYERLGLAEVKGGNKNKWVS